MKLITLMTAVALVGMPAIAAQAQSTKTVTTKSGNTKATTTVSTKGNTTTAKTTVTKSKKGHHHARKHSRKHSANGMIAKQAKAEGESTATEMKEHKAAARHHVKRTTKKAPASTTTDTTTNSTQQ
jgi:hypothetical protein